MVGLNDLVGLCRICVVDLGDRITGNSVVRREFIVALTAAQAFVEIGQCARVARERNLSRR